MLEAALKDSTLSIRTCMWKRFALCVIFYAIGFKKDKIPGLKIKIFKYCPQYLCYE